MKQLKSLVPIFSLAVALSPMMAGAEIPKTASLYDRLGGQPAIQAVTDDFVARILADGRVNRWFAHAAGDPARAAAYKVKLASFICVATGGPCKYSGMDMMAAHKDRGITTEAFNAVVEDLVATLDKLKVPEAEKKQLLGLLAPLKVAVVQKQ
ncbi:MAG: group I truncated hemoglobin [Bryobacteraceae bacterium]